MKEPVYNFIEKVKDKEILKMCEDIDHWQKLGEVDQNSRLYFWYKRFEVMEIL